MSFKCGGHCGGNRSSGAENTVQGAAGAKALRWEGARSTEGAAERAVWLERRAGRREGVRQGSEEDQDPAGASLGIRGLCLLL